MTIHTTLADQAILEELATLEPSAEEVPSQVKTASAQRASGAKALMKVGEVIEVSRRIGRARAESEIAALLGR